MPDTNTSGVVSSGPLPRGDGTIPGDAVPMPLPIAVGEPAPGGGRVRFVVGTEGDDTLTIEGGATAVGGGGNDTFVLTTNGANDGLERLGSILDYNEGDKLDLSKLGANAAIVGREAIEGGERISIDYNGDGKADGVLDTYTGKGPATVEPSPDDGEFHILPYPMPVDDGEFHILPYPMPGDDGVVTILPYPLPGEAVILPVDFGGGIGDGAGIPVDFDGGIGDGEVHILPYPMPGDGEFVVNRIASDWAI